MTRRIPTISRPKDVAGFCTAMSVPRKNRRCCLRRQGLTDASGVDGTAVKFDCGNENLILADVEERGLSKMITFPQLQGRVSPLKLITSLVAVHNHGGQFGCL
jgi:hypothetical protein